MLLIPENISSSITGRMLIWETLVTHGCFFFPMSSNQGIQTLLEAEKEASKIVAKARACNPLLTQIALNDLNMPGTKL